MMENVSGNIGNKTNDYGFVVMILDMGKKHNYDLYGPKSNDDVKIIERDLELILSPYSECSVDETLAHLVFGECSLPKLKDHIEKQNPSNYVELKNTLRKFLEKTYIISRTNMQTGETKGVYHFNGKDKYVFVNPKRGGFDISYIQPTTLDEVMARSRPNLGVTTEPMPELGENWKPLDEATRKRLFAGAYVN